MTNLIPLFIDLLVAQGMPRANVEDWVTAQRAGLLGDAALVTMLTWHREGFTTHQALPWMAVTSSPEEAAAWRRAGYAPVQAGRYLRAGVTLAEAHACRADAEDEQFIAALETMAALLDESARPR